MPRRCSNARGLRGLCQALLPRRADAEDGSSLVADLRSGEAVVEHLTRRPVWSALTRLHYNPGSWWTVFADIFGGG